ncbi:EAL domain-containing protein, partial [Patulibacter sp. S7RM1-6]
RTLRRLREALDDDRLVLDAQPVLALAADERVRDLLLPRVVGPGGALSALGRFLPVVREHGLARRLDRRILEQAARLAATGRAVEIEVCAETATDPSFPACVTSTLEAAGASPGLLTLTVPGEAFSVDEPLAAACVRRAAGIGCAVALRGFGAAPIPVAVLRAVPWDELQIDLAFATGLQEDERARGAVRGLVGLAGGFGLRTAAVGVDDATTAALLVRLGVDLGRGDALGVPAPLATDAPAVQAGPGQE